MTDTPMEHSTDRSGAHSGVHPGAPSPTFSQKAKRAAHIAWLVVEYMFDRAADRVEEYWAVVRRELDLFLGMALVIIGLMNFENGKNCDGNTTDYLSCTRPSTFYYFNALEIILVVLGVFLIMIWFLQRTPKRT